MMIWSLALLIGALSALLYARRRLWPEATLVLVASVAFAGLYGLPVWSGSGILDNSAASTLTLITEGASAAALDEVKQELSSGRVLDLRAGQTPMLELQQAFAAASSITLRGSGLRAQEWQDLPVKPVRSTGSAEAGLWLEFARDLTLGREFSLSVRRAKPEANWRLQLLAENQQIIAEAAVTGAPSATLRVTWLPPVTGRLVLQARVLDGKGQLIASGPIPLQVLEARALQVLGRFHAASFDAQALNQLLIKSGAQLDWQVTLGKALVRQEASAQPTAAQLAVVDAAWMERATALERNALLANVAQGLPLIILGASATDHAFWAGEFQLNLAAAPLQSSKAGSATGAAPTVFGHGGLELAATALRPATAQKPATWQALAREQSQQSQQSQQTFAWERPWHQGKLVWLGAADWHRYTIAAPQAVGLWWQDLLDQIGIGQASERRWLPQEGMPMAGWRSTVCAQGVDAQASVSALHQQPQLQPQWQMRWQRRADQADALCVALWPQQSGWMTWRTADGADHAEYMFAAQDWPAWQRALRADATQLAALRTQQWTQQWTQQRQAENDASQRTAIAYAVPPLRWFWALLFFGALLMLWWRERR